MRRWRTWRGPRACNATYVSRVLRLTLLAPEIVEAILDGRQPEELQLDDLLEGFPLEWEGQRAFQVAPPSEAFSHHCKYMRAKREFLIRNQMPAPSPQPEDWGSASDRLRHLKCVP